ncbi:cysteine--tRNA ligase [Candidatus Saccharibacteria bacterium]|nr:cysteine--tRNA ligase [Candidatus Saccharibacteria bacterium]
MQIRFFNSLSKSIEEFKPTRTGRASLYTCGPTVYDHVHIGNLRTYIFEDLLRRTLRNNGFNVLHVMNITDIDDKTIKRSRQQFPDEEPHKALSKLTAKYEKLFYEDAAKVGIDLTDSKIIKATDHIQVMQDLIRQIPSKYVSDDGIYFDIESYKDYGVLVKLDRSHQHHRIDNDEYDKDHVADFALWKIKQAGEPSWEFEIDGKNLEGRPGWHIECSAMSVKYLGQPFDIHTGGIDLMFPHHENEIAQSRSAADMPLANYFIHAEHLLVEGRRMGKSLKNFYTLDDIVAKNFDPLAFRLLTLQAHYRHQLNFTWEALQAAQAFLGRLRAWSDLQFQPALGHKKNVDQTYASSLDEIRKTLNDDLNTSQAVAILSSLAGAAERDGVGIDSLKELLVQIDQLLGLGLSTRSDITPDEKSMIVEREKSRESGDWEKADQLRKQLLARSLEINDTPHGPVWSRTN